jgi:nucleotide-binding universal stress UspA family protein
VTTTLNAAVPSAQAGPVDLRNRVVVGLDDDPVSVEALRFGATEAAFRGGDVLALHVWHYPSSWGYPMPWPQETSLGALILPELLRTVEQVTSERAAAGETAVAITAKVVQGDDSFALCTAAHGGALLVLGARHHNRLLGSVSQACVNHPPCPVVIVPTKEATS